MIRAEYSNGLVKEFAKTGDYTRVTITPESGADKAHSPITIAIPIIRFIFLIFNNSRRTIAMFRPLAYAQNKKG